MDEDVEPSADDRAGLRRYILTYQGYGKSPDAMVEEIGARTGLALVNQSSRMLLVEATPGAFRTFADGLVGWQYDPERRYARPKTF